MYKWSMHAPKQGHGWINKYVFTIIWQNTLYEQNQISGISGDTELSGSYQWVSARKT